jgi:hypothetical protein
MPATEDSFFLIGHERHASHRRLSCDAKRKKSYSNQRGLSTSPTGHPGRPPATRSSGHRIGTADFAAPHPRKC